MIKSFRILFSSLAVLLILLSCSLPVLAYELEPGELPGSTVETYPDELPMFFNETGITITSQPVDAYGQIGDAATFTVIATGEITSYQWQYRSPSSTSWKNCGTNTPGYNTNSISPFFNEARNGQSYRCIISNSLGYVVSDVATLYVGDPPETEPPVIDPPEVDNSFTIGEVLDLFDTGAAAVVSWFSAIMDSTGAGTVYIAMMSVVLSVAILLGPLLGSTRSGLSDVVHRPRQKEDNK